MLPFCGFASPLTIYDQANLEGTGAVVPDTYTIYSGSGIPGTLNNKISSFLLDEGYMVIVADPTDGLNPSKTYIADDGPLTVNTLPAELDNKISFIRVVPWKYTLKKGTCGDLNSNPSLNANWYYAWGYNVAKGQAIDSREYVPMSWGRGSTDPDDIANYHLMDQVTHLLSFNESDSPDDQSGKWFNPPGDPYAAVPYHKLLQKSGLRLGSPNGRENAARNETSYTSLFLNECDAQGIRVDFVGLHWYDWGSNPAANPNDPAEIIFNRFKEYLSNAYRMYRRPLWITEFNANIHRDTATQDAFLQLALPYLETLGYVERYAYYQPNSGTGDFFSGGQLTATGQIYKDQVSTPAYTSKGLPDPWLDLDIGAVAAAGDTIHANGTFTVCGTGAGISGTTDEFRYVYRSMTGDGEMVARVNSMVRRDSWTKAGVMIRETLDAGSRHVSMFISEDYGAAFQYRTAAGSSGSTTHAGIQAPYWVKLVRHGNTLTGYFSSNGTSWTPLGSQTISMSSTVYVGLAASSHNDGPFCDATFTDVSYNDIKHATVLVGGSTLNGDFNAGSEGNFTVTPDWQNLFDNQTSEATRSNLDYDGTLTAVLATATAKIFGLNTAYTISAGDIFDISYVWRDASGWDDGADQVRVSLFVTHNNLIGGARSNLFVDLSELSTLDSTYETVNHDSIYTATAGDAGKTLFVAIDTTCSASEYARLDNFELIVSSTTALSGYDLWAISHNMTGAQAGATSDYDLDGWNNLLEYGLGGDPASIAVTGTSPVPGPVAQVGGTNWIEYIHLQRTNANHGLTYTLEQTPDLMATWSNCTDAVVSGTGPAAGSDFMIVTNRIPIDGKANEFIRLRIDN